MASLKKDLFFVIMQFLNENGMNETARTLEKETSLYFNMKYFEGEVMNGNWDEAEKYVSAFTRIDDNSQSTRIFFDIRKQKYLEALDENDRAKAIDILLKDLKVFSTTHEELFKEMTQLLTMENIRENENLSEYLDAKTMRRITSNELNKLITTNPMFRDKLQFPNITNSRLQTLINQSLNWQHHLCKRPKPVLAEVKTLFVDHNCGQPSNNLLLGESSRLNGEGPSQPAAPTPVDPTPLPFLPASSERAPVISVENAENRNLVNVKPRVTDKSVIKSKIQKLSIINEPALCRSLRLMDKQRPSKISRLTYTNSGLSILALASNATHVLWKWPCESCRLPNGKATTSVPPDQWLPLDGTVMTNDIISMNPGTAVNCFALSRNGSYAVSSSGGRISLFNVLTYEKMKIFTSAPPAVTFLAFLPQDNNIFAIGLENSLIALYKIWTDEIIATMRGHTERITGLVFSNKLNVMVSSGADARICVWNKNGWGLNIRRSLQIPSTRGTSSSVSDTKIEFHQDQVHLLVVHETHIAIYKAMELVRVSKWVPDQNTAPITHATFSGDGRLIYASFLDATVRVLRAENLTLLCQINPVAYLPADVSTNVYPQVIAANPKDPNQFAVGLTDGGVHILEPVESEGKWGDVPVEDNKMKGSTRALKQIDLNH